MEITLIHMAILRRGAVKNTPAVADKKTTPNKMKPNSRRRGSAAGAEKRPMGRWMAVKERPCPLVFFGPYRKNKSLSTRNTNTNPAV